MMPVNVARPKRELVFKKYTLLLSGRNGIAFATRQEYYL